MKTLRLLSMVSAAVVAASMMAISVSAEETGENPIQIDVVTPPPTINVTTEATTTEASPTPIDIVPSQDSSYDSYEVDNDANSNQVVVTPAAETRPSPTTGNSTAAVALIPVCLAAAALVAKSTASATKKK